MGRKKKDDEEERSPIAKFLIGISVAAGALIGARLLLDALNWWSGGPGTLTARIGVGLAVILAVIIWWKTRNRRK